MTTSTKAARFTALFNKKKMITMPDTVLEAPVVYQGLLP